MDKTSNGLVKAEHKSGVAWNPRESWWGRSLLRSFHQIRVRLVFREANFCFDALYRRGLSQYEDFAVSGPLGGANCCGGLVVASGVVHWSTFASATLFELQIKLLDLIIPDENPCENFPLKNPLANL
ncbi:hypothetical protein CFP56_024944 [Quercus suber]|uniref:Uncharacterized protein n=1 Tax=Quercus suber TaxID=58331 RepID=A0AAW0LX11_QUESU